MNPDGIAYLDMGDAYLRGDWSTALRSHWSPLYAWLLGAAMRLVKPAPNAEFPLVHLVNLVIYVLALAAFAVLMHEVRGRGLPGWAVVSVGYGAFVWCALQYMPLSLVTPDLLVSALVFAICGVVLRISRGPSARAATVLGILLGLGFLAKAPMLPLGVVFLIVSTLVIAERPKRIPHLTWGSLGLVAVAAPFIVALSLANGRLTLSDSAMLNYLWRIDGAPFVHWQGGPGGIGQPLHHSTLLLERPAVFAFISPFQVTYSAWYAPEYWFAGATPSLVWSRQIQAIGDALEVYSRLALDLWIPLAGLVILLAVHPALNVRSAALLLPAVAAFVMYALVLVEERYVAPFLVLFLLGLLMLVQLPSRRWVTALSSAVFIVVVGSLVLQIGSRASELTQLPQGDLLAPDDHALVATALRSAGIQPGDPVATGNRGFNAYWARLARVPIVAEVSGYDGTAILDSDPQARAAAEQILLAQPVRAVVAYSWPLQTADPAWRRIEGTPYFYYLLPRL
jgi:hypothetical protein